MHLQNILVPLAASVASVRAAAVPNLPPGFPQGSYSLLHSRPLENGTLYYWGDASEAAKAKIDWDAGWDENAVDVPTPSPIPMQRRCGSNVVHCSNTNLARTDVCQQAVDALRANLGGSIAYPVQVISFRSGDFWCNIAWADRINNLVNGYLVAAASKTLGLCGTTGSVSGWADDVSLNNICTTQYMSNA
ncbi:hypothetical protein C8A03DRAFT_17855 [Achaetomium macrosporum]|uniref:Uncharacterized protein n=1 Tax=Achaetomium macrosporum TaxID=79813 RepID=A0AAN7C537_9PEZI|nr:hypothetical protein C8A03DRAFT_17855 [Achaetomium macrosporum]